MGSQKNTITINGKVYDATTGMVIADPTPTQVIKPVSVVSSQKTIEPVTITPTSQKIKVNVETTKPDTSHPKAHRHIPSTAKHLHQRTERTKTLKRNAVKKPTSQKTGNATIAISGLVAQPDHKIVHSATPERTIRASKVSRSASVSRFANDSNKEVSHKLESIPVKAAPRNHEDSQHTQNYVSQQAPPISVPRSASQQNYFATAIENSTSHQPTKIGISSAHHKRKHSRRRQLTTAALALFVLGSFYAYNSIPKLSLRLNASETGFVANVPSYNPTGFSLNRDIQTAAGSVVMSYNSRTDNRAFNITQEKTTLNNETFSSLYLQNKSNAYETKTESGKTIYIYNDSNAAWIEDGILYNIQGNAELSRDQLLNLASSL